MKRETATTLQKVMPTLKELAMFYFDKHIHMSGLACTKNKLPQKIMALVDVGDTIMSTGGEEKLASYLVHASIKFNRLLNLIQAAFVKMVIDTCVGEFQRLDMNCTR